MSVLRLRRRQQAPESSDHSFYFVNMFNPSYPEGGVGGNQLLSGSISLPPAALSFVANICQFVQVSDNSSLPI